jgi:predicted Fe-Mo cluster-binding NifX family protein
VGSIPKFVHDKGASYIIAGGMGPRAVDFFNQFGIETIVGITGSVDEIINKFISGKLEGGASICAPGAGKGYGVNKIHTEADGEHEHHHHPL